MGTKLIDEKTAFICEDALDQKGLVVTQTDAGTAGEVKLVDTDKEVPAGVAIKTTEDPFALGSYLTDELVALQTVGETECVLASDNAAIVKGDPLMAVKDAANKEGVVDKLTIRSDTAANLLADLQAMVGTAAEAKGANAGATYGTKIKVKLKLFFW